MKVSREQAAENRGKILQAAAQLFREKGFDGIGIADLMKKVGLTHGGFYGHFASKEDLMSQACDYAVDELLELGQVNNPASAKEGNRYKTFITRYLSGEHRDNPGQGCLMAALGADAARQTPQVKQAFTQSFNRLLNALIQLLPLTKTPAARREQAILTMATLVGAQVMARAVDDPVLSQEILKVVQKNLH
ncbi:TetR/AcrR family transcriptional regulator [Cellvibrio sp. pealriver]|uniref:TetR/AcrR family transcriptional regulator n=1 Tax=Cellvibrio sp. pealriver TaxID=1622269 RepID=UPI00066FFF2A|nr:TetR/AcrR family transcriptional regulator [Cellvibrio sp. pealriver]